MPKTREEYNLESGLASDFDGTIVDAPFVEPSADYQRVSQTKDPALNLVIDSPEHDNPISESYSIGAKKKWQVINGDQEVVSETAPNSHTFNMNSKGGILVERMYQLLGKGDREKGIEFFMKKDCWMTQSGFYKGLTFHWMREKMKAPPDDSGQVKEVAILLPTAYLGESAVAAKATAAASAGPKVSELDQILKDLASGKDEKGLRLACAKDAKLRANPQYLREVINGTKIKDMEAAGEIVKVDGKFV